MYPMPLLHALFERHGKYARWWIGERPDVREGQTARTIAAKLGYPNGRDDPFVPGGLTPVTLADAAYVLAVATTTSLVHFSEPKPQAIRAAKQALAELHDGPTWLVNGWHPGAVTSWISMTDATFDCGVIGYDRQNAFIFWIEEED